MSAEDQNNNKYTGDLSAQGLKISYQFTTKLMSPETGAEEPDEWKVKVTVSGDDAPLARTYGYDTSVAFESEEEAHAHGFLHVANYMEMYEDKAEDQEKEQYRKSVWDLKALWAQTAAGYCLELCDEQEGILDRLQVMEGGELAAKESVEKQAEEKKASPIRGEVFEVKVDELGWHPVLKDMPISDDEDWATLKASIKQHGVRESISLTLDPDESAENKWLIVDGRHRVLAAEDAGVEMVIAREVPWEEATEIAIDSLASRRAINKSQMAYQLAGYYGQCVERGNAQKSQNHGKDTETEMISVSGETSEQFAKRVGISDKYLRNGLRIHEWRETHPAIVQEAVDAIFRSNNPISIADAYRGLKAAIEGGEDNGKRKDLHEKPFDRAKKVIVTFGKSINAQWEKMDKGDRAKLADEVTAVMTGMNPGARALFKDSIEQIEG